MIEFKLTKQFQKQAPVNLLTAINRVEYTLNSLREDIDILPVVKFDPLYTKPVNLTSIDIVGKSLEEPIVVTLDVYTQKWLSYKWAAVLSKVERKTPEKIDFNTRVLSTWKMSVDEWVENIFHELIHVWDHHSPYVFWHGDNKLDGKDNSAPVKLSKILMSVSIGLQETRPVEALLW